MYEYIVPQELSIADRIGSFTIVQWVFIASGFMIFMFLLINQSIPFWITLVLGIPIISLSFFLAIFKKHDMFIYEFALYYFLFLIQPKEMVYGSNYNEEITIDANEEENIVLN